MPVAMQEACQFHSLAVNRGFFEVETIFQREKINDVVKIALNWNFLRLAFGRQQ
ncbi:hypothetical protein [Sphingopyxis sp. GC21]|uniref:hypothetical protein n=1 Tax=Sphingopyxis sp. GC21 TaxID=2933562 RepID=UPI0021E44607|nr:hypothetical protein [Sphingopyxis sp. GC21]